MICFYYKIFKYDLNTSGAGVCRSEYVSVLNVVGKTFCTADDGILLHRPVLTSRFLYIHFKPQHC